MRRGEVRWYTFKEPDKRRPVLLLTRDSVIPYLNSVTVAPITTTIRAIPSEVFLSPEDGLLTDCVANLDSILTVAKPRLGPLIARLSTERMLAVNLAIRFALGAEE